MYRVMLWWTVDGLVAVPALARLRERLIDPKISRPTSGGAASAKVGWGGATKAEHPRSRREVLLPPILSILIQQTLHAST